MPEIGQLVKCPRCRRMFRWGKEYTDHAWKERP